MPWTFSAAFPCRPRSARSARKALIEHLSRAGLATEVLDEIECAAGEALANAVEHGAPLGGRFHVRAAIDDDSVLIEIEDTGCGFDPGDPAAWRGSGENRGRGIFIMGALMDRVDYANGGRVVRLVKGLHQRLRRGPRARPYALS